MAACPAFDVLTGLRQRIKVVDIGANPHDGEDLPYLPLLLAGDADCVGFDANPAAVSALNQRKGPHETYLQLAVADGQRHMLHVCAAQGMTSLLEPNPAVLKLFHGFPEWGRVTSRAPIDTVRLDDVAETAGMDFLKMDIQGSELMALRNGVNRLRDALVIHTEAMFLPMYKEQPLFSDIDLLLREFGFVLHCFAFLTSRAIAPILINNDPLAEMRQLLWTDAVFIRDFTRPDRLSNDQLLRMAKIMNDCYGSVGLATHLVTEHDRRCGTSLRNAYLSGLIIGAGQAGK